MTAAELVETAKSMGVSFRVNIRGQIFARVTRKLPPGLLESLRQNKAGIAAHVTHSTSPFVWNAVVDGVNCRVIDPQRQVRAEFENSMAMQFGKHRVQSCTRLWPPADE